MNNGCHISWSESHIASSFEQIDVFMCRYCIRPQTHSINKALRWCELWGIHKDYEWNWCPPWLMPYSQIFLLPCFHVAMIPVSIKYRASYKLAGSDIQQIQCKRNNIITAENENYPILQVFSKLEKVNIKEHQVCAIH